jgi:hypothetical protein
VMAMTFLNGWLKRLLGEPGSIRALSSHKKSATDIRRIASVQEYLRGRVSALRWRKGRFSI